jgi:hypothetical protein
LVGQLGKYPRLDHRDADRMQRRVRGMSPYLCQPRPHLLALVTLVVLHLGPQVDGSAEQVHAGGASFRLVLLPQVALGLAGILVRDTERRNPSPEDRGRS